MNKNEKPLVLRSIHQDSPYTREINGAYVKQIAVRIPIPTTDTIRDKDGRNREIRYISGCDSIYVDEQINDYKFDRKRPATILDKSDLTIENGYLLVYPNNKSLTEFIKVCNYNSTNTSRIPTRGALFFIENKEAEDKKAMDTSIIILEAKSLILTTMKNDEEKFRKVAEALLGMDCSAFETADLFNKLSFIAEKDSSKIFAAFKATDTALIDMINEAERFGIITIANTKTTWTSSGETIATYKVGGSPKDKLKDYLHKSENLNLLNTIKERVKMQKEEEVKNEVVA